MLWYVLKDIDVCECQRDGLFQPSISSNGLKAQARVLSGPNLNPHWIRAKFQLGHQIGPVVIICFSVVSAIWTVSYLLKSPWTLDGSKGREQIHSDLDNGWV